MEALMRSSTPGALAVVLERMLRMCIAGAIPITLGVGVCGTLSVQYLQRSRERTTYKVLLCAVGALSSLCWLVLVLNLVHVSSHLDSMADLYYWDSISIITMFLLTSMSAYLSQLLFIHRAYILTGRRRLRVIPLLVTAHVALLSQVGLDIYGYMQPRWDSTASITDLDRVKAWWTGLLRVRSVLQVMWAVSSLACDLMICTMIIVALLRMRTFFDRTKGVINRFALMITETMLPPMILAAIYAGVIISGSQGPGSWFRNIAALQAVFYWFAVVWSLRTRSTFLAMLDPPRPRPPVVPTPPYTPAQTPCSQVAPGQTDRAPAACTAGQSGLSCTLVPSFSDDDKSAARVDQDVEKKPWTAGFYDRAESDQVMTMDEALQGPDLLYGQADGQTDARGLNIMV